MDTVPVVCFEAPHRIRKTLTDCDLYFGKRPILLARELTKAFEEWLRGPAESLLQQLSSERGEFVLLVEPVPEPVSRPEPPSDHEIARVFGRITETDRDSRRRAIRKVADQLGIAPKAVFMALERQKNSVE
jgi:16S rRNA (cytidine1402-2'-O)-methyltransferase